MFADKQIDHSHACRVIQPDPASLDQRPHQKAKRAARTALSRLAEPIGSVPTQSVVTFQLSIAKAIWGNLWSSPHRGGRFT